MVGFTTETQRGLVFFDETRSDFVHHRDTEDTERFSLF